MELSLDYRVRSEKPVSVSYKDTGTGTATAGDDYDGMARRQPHRRHHIHSPWRTWRGTRPRKRIRYSRTTKIEDDETVVIRYFEPVNAIFKSGSDSQSYTITILDDDSPHEIHLSVSRATVAENAGPTSVTVTARRPGKFHTDPASTVTVAVGGHGRYGDRGHGLRDRGRLHGDDPEGEALRQRYGHIHADAGRRRRVRGERDDYGVGDGQ